MPGKTFTRVRDKATGHHYSVAHVDPSKHEVLKQPAVDANGRTLPAKPRVDVSQAREKNTTSKDTPKEQS